MQDGASNPYYVGLNSGLLVWFGFFLGSAGNVSSASGFSCRGCPWPRRGGLDPEQHTRSRLKWRLNCPSSVDQPAAWTPGGRSLTWGMCPIWEDFPSWKDRVPRVKCSPPERVFWGLPLFSPCLHPQNPSAEQSHSFSLRCCYEVRVTPLRTAAGTQGRD